MAAALDERNPARAAIAIERLAGHYPRMHRDDAAATAWAEDWLEDTAHLPPFVIEEACAEWRRSDERWMPTPGQLLVKAERILALREGEFRRACALLESDAEAA
jgi:hypothetical protein